MKKSEGGKNTLLKPLLIVPYIPLIQESSPAGNRKRRTARGITCPSISYRGGGVPTLAGGGYQPWWGIPTLAGGVPTLARDLGSGGTYLGQGGTYLG